MILLKAYQYLFYKLYKSIEYTSFPKFWSDWKALIALLGIEMWTGGSFVFYYQAITGKSVNDMIFLLMGMFLVLTNWYLFEHKDKWKGIVKEFDQLPKKQNKKGSFIVLLVVLASIANVVFSVYTLSQSVTVD